eukprot:TRINITY_DN16328_c0_g1_i1.p1 TRINITY_DN16328_c0_g1~~TRINITY_DN16328_c0_g1_i1.p1  ORF type:complete len:473 (+),score=125.13 TRINITY_DN16328_c0_g1_i1:157-1575(+)
MAEEVRVDPSDGQAYEKASFIQVYGDDWQRHWDDAKPVMPQQGRGIPLPPQCTPVKLPGKVNPLKRPREPCSVVPSSVLPESKRPRTSGLPPCGRFSETDKGGRIGGPSLFDVYAPQTEAAHSAVPSAAASAAATFKFVPLLQPLAGVSAAPTSPTTPTTPVTPVQPRQIRPGCYPEEFGHLPLGSRLLLVGEGNFSLSRDLVTKLQSNNMDASSLVCTVYDSEVVAEDKYPDIQQNVQKLRAQGATVLFDFDGTSAKCFDNVSGYLEAIVFHCPHTGDKQHFHWNPGPEVIQKSIDNNRELLRGFFAAIAASRHRDANVFVTLKSGNPYSFWGLEQQAAKSGFLLQAAVGFDAASFPLYDHRRTLPNKNAKSKKSSVNMKDAMTNHFRYDPEPAQTRLAELPQPQDILKRRIVSGYPGVAQNVQQTATTGQTEFRVDANDGQLYTKEDFIACYGGTEEWDRSFSVTLNTSS